MATTPAIDYDALAQQHGATVDYDSLAAQHGGSAAAQPGLLDKANEYAGKALSAAGLPTSLSNVPDWFRHLTGTHPNSEPFWAPIREAIKNPTQENIVNAVPFIGPSAVSMSKDVNQGNYGGAAATLAGTVGAGVLPAKTGEIAGGLNQAGQVLGDTAGTAKDALANALRDESGKLKPSVQKAATAIGGIGGAAHGVMHGNLESAAIGGYAGSRSLPKVIDALAPSRSAIAEPLSEGPTYPALQEDSRAALNKPQSSNILTSESQKQPQSMSTPSVSPLSSPPAPNLPGGPGSFNSPSVPDLEDVLNQVTGSKPPQPNVPLREQLGSAAQAKVANVPTQEPNYAYRVRSQGEEGLPISQGNKGAHATTTLEDAQRLSEGRGSLPENEGVPQEIVKFDLNKLGDQDYTRIPREGGPDWLRLSRPLKESELEMVRPQGEAPAQSPKMETPASSSGETDPLKIKYPDPAQRQMVRANGERIVQAIGDDPDTMKAVHDLTRVDLRQAAINHGIDMGQTTVSNSKFAGEGSITRENMFNKLLDEGLKPQDIVRLAKQPPLERVEGEDVVQHVMKTSNIHNENDAHQLVGLDSGGQYDLKDVPVNKLKLSNDVEPDVVQKYANKKSSSPAIVLDGDGRIRDGNHRLAAAKLRGDSTIKAYVPVDSTTGQSQDFSDKPIKNPFSPDEVNALRQAYKP